MTPLLRSTTSSVLLYLPGIVLVAIVTAAAYGLRTFPYVTVLSPMITAIFLGMLMANTGGVPAAAGPGMALCGKRLLRMAVALLGLQITLSQIGESGWIGILGAAVALTSTFVFTIVLGRVVGVSRSLSYLLAGGISICGASAAAAVGAATRARDEEIAYSIACVTVFGTVAMFGYPLLINVLGLGPEDYGQWIGYSVHEVAQVVAAGFQAGAVEGEAAIVAKLTRVMMLAPVILVVAFVFNRVSGGEAEGGRKVSSAIPTFVVAFIALALLNSFNLVPEQVRSAAVAITPIMLTAALGALGLATRFDHVYRHGLRPLALGAASSLFIAVVSLMWVKAF